MCFPVPTLELSFGCFFAVWLIIASYGFVFLSGGDKDESEDSVGDLRRTESDSVLKKVGIQLQLLSKISTPPHLTVSSNFKNTIKINLATPPSTELASWLFPSGPVVIGDHGLYNQ